jgi:EAL domain-containing protein (putative c-di-GMP-specific phosphodiesterase class I)
VVNFTGRIALRRAHRSGLGTGHSSLAYLRQFPVNAIKIDRAFITDGAQSPEGRALMQTFVQLGKALRIETIAEGIEDNAQLAVIRAERCDSAQGFLFARPMPADAIEQLFEAKGPGPADQLTAPAFGN